ncbi:hypothetical protein BJV82DRAFT_532031 [Fennellomyces sp. T-0311]|nr:hypothetical protein BJV82DRAFT_532031 [Fennellomyces sp. T-0311]
MTKPFHQNNNQKRRFQPNKSNNGRVQKNDRPNNYNKKPNPGSQQRRKANSRPVDRDRSQPNNAPAQVKAPLFDRSQLQPQWLSAQRVGPGLINGQNTCFLNSVLQCLTYTPPLAQYLLSAGHKKQCKMPGYCALCSMETHMYRVFKEPKSTIRGAAILPKYFTANLQALSKTLRLRRQEDSHEFLMFLFTAFQKSLLHGLGKVSPEVEESTVLHSIFGGRVQSQVRCHSCQAKSNTFEAFLDLSVDIHRANSLEMALKNYVKVDMIGGRDPDSKYKCSGCNQKVNAGKQVTIRSLPTMMIVHLKRFTFDLERGYMRKVSERIQYPEVLDMAPYVSDEEKSKIKGKSKYRLYGVLVHLGHSCSSGHYYAFIKSSDGQWYMMDDEEVTKVTKKDVFREQAYMLFYANESASNQGGASNAKAAQEELASSKKEQEEALKDVNEEKEESITGKRQASDEESLESPPLSKKSKSNDEEQLVPDGNQSWYIRSADLPFRSLRGNLSPPTFSAAINDPSAWTIRSTDDAVKEDEKKPAKDTVGKKSRRKIAPWVVVG